ncbi:sulfurtransferase TusA family protein [Halomonas sp. McH1-25]|uniref:sulfurtransferase TusA family protein n=1 Tax=unclassified Halomonas TaxID=2609666 RepID=UPI001EF6CC99|nr:MULTISPECIES: sulfurtransferase TusA family protein [unclassified Halomonas]MCG7600741.1 sulfurtransferase TusA family protein [Halomonas sp. McH1-25]MCP1341319.1 sulfurtransferase TusA family protein [Halomonas sp. FL8]MCP1363047.1 sulfurtransferase TusA family protein [Halomonas sp. BBD45]MCP1365899.1 sulfurtransferase TusA family protein [Halomonas sp. BBD48]
MALQPDDVLDARGLHCPLPLLKTKQALSRLAEGELLHVLATDPGSWRDFETFIDQSDFELVSREEIDDEFHYWIRKGGVVA